MRNGIIVSSLMFFALLTACSNRPNRISDQSGKPFPQKASSVVPIDGSGDTLDGEIGGSGTTEWFDPESGETVTISSSRAFVVFEKEDLPFTHPEWGYSDVIPISSPGTLDTLEGDPDVLNFLNTSGASLIFEYPEPRVILVRLPAGMTFDEAYGLWPQQYPAITRIEPDEVLESCETNPNDPEFPDQWALHRPIWPSNPFPLDAVHAWDWAVGRRAIYIAAIDSGVGKIEDIAREEQPNPLYWNVTEYGADIPNPNIEPNAPKYRVGYWDRFVNGEYQHYGQAYTGYTHGTQTASVAAAVGNNNLWMSGGGLEGQDTPDPP